MVLGKRIIPALAGNTRVSVTLSVSRRDHPRSRGEYTGRPSLRGQGSGSSPLSRGILMTTATEITTARIIPALAGNTNPGRGAQTPPRDHPRSRGEYLAFLGEDSLPRGSSPLSRGIQMRVVERAERDRIIPALAGNTGPNHILFVPETGSSPLSRGIHLLPQPRFRRRRIIPALAGNTRTIAMAFVAARDHPRSRGEYCCSPSLPGTVMGSSPLSRGILRGAPGSRARIRIIPALAGNTSSTPPTRCSRTDHPRSRGEYWVLMAHG